MYVVTGFSLQTFQTSSYIAVLVLKLVFFKVVFLEIRVF